MLIKKEYRKDNRLVQRAQLLFVILVAYVIGGILAGLLHYWIQYNVFHVVSAVLCIVVLYDAYQLGVVKLLILRRPVIRKYISVDPVQTASKVKKTFKVTIRSKASKSNAQMT
jgi:hypothetical protein